MKRKDSFILHLDSLDIIDLMSDEMIVKFFKIIIHYQKTGEILEMDDALKMATIPFINQFKRDNEKYKAKCKVNSINGLSGGRPKTEKTQSVILKPKKAKKAYNDNDNDNDNDSDNDSESEKEKDNDNNWRAVFEIYKAELFEVYLRLIADDEFIRTQERFHPNVDIKLSLDKAVTNYWGTEAGWKYKKKQKSKTIDWQSTLTNAIGMNKVYKNPSAGPKLQMIY